jgi:hypothetical protein
MFWNWLLDDGSKWWIVYIFLCHFGVIVIVMPGLAEAIQKTLAFCSKLHARIEKTYGSGQKWSDD